MESSPIQPCALCARTLQHGETLYREVNLSNMIYTQHLQHTQSHIYLCVYLSICYTAETCMGVKGDVIVRVCVCARAARSRARSFLSLTAQPPQGSRPNETKLSAGSTVRNPHRPRRQHSTDEIK